MRLDIFRRAEQGGNFSYLAIPEGNDIPEEATNVDWEVEARGVDLDDDSIRLENFAIDDPIEQISLKGYAISSLESSNGASGGQPVSH